ncbi:MAG: GLPGLI family protein [Bacteroides sp.]
MKKHLLLFALWWLAATTATAQFKVFMPEPKCTPDTLGMAQLLVMYDMRSYIDTSKQRKPLEEEAILEIGNGLSKFYSYAQFVCDSVYADDVARKAPQETILGHLNQYSNYHLTEVVCKNYPSGQCTVLETVAGSTRLRYEEKTELPQWQLTEETDSVMGYACQSAECSYRGRRWKVWYTPTIAVGEGPWKLCGLPGLILKAEDSEGHYLFTAKGLKQCQPPRPIIAKLAIHEAVSRKQYDKVHERYWNDPVGFVSGNNPNTTMEVTDEHGNPVRPRGVAHNPIER